MSEIFFVETLTSVDTKLADITSKLSSDTQKLIGIINKKPINTGNLNGITCVSFFKGGREGMIKLPLATVYTAISKNTQISSLTQSLVKRNAANMEYKDAKVLTLIPEDEVGLYSIKSYTYNPIIKYPVRGSHCTHYDVVDLEYLIRFIYTKGWMCPLCGKKISLKTICVDNTLQKELRNIEKLPEEKHPDLLLYTKNGKGFGHANFKSLFNDIWKKDMNFEFPSVTEDYFRKTACASILHFESMWITPDRGYLEFIFELNTSIKSQLTTEEIIIIPIIIFGGYEITKSTRAQLIDVSKDKNVHFVTFAYNLCKYGFKTRQAISRFVMSLNQKLKIVILTDKNYSKSLSDLASVKALVQDRTTKMLCPPGASHSTIEQYRHKPSSEDIMEDLKELIKIQGTKCEFVKTFSKALNAQFKFGKCLPNYTRWESGIVFRFSLGKDHFFESGNYMQVIPTNNKDVLRVKVSITALQQLSKSSNVIIYFPGYKLGNEVVNNLNGLYVAVLNSNISEEIDLEYLEMTIVLSMLISDFTAISYSEQQDLIVRSIIDAKIKYPQLASKTVYVYISQYNKDEKVDIETFALDFFKNCSLDKKFFIYKKENSKEYFCWKYNIWFIKSDESTSSLSNFYTVLSSKLTVLTNNNTIAFLKEEASLASAIRGRLTGLTNKRLNVTEENTTVEEVILAVTIADK